MKDFFQITKKLTRIKIRGVPVKGLTLSNGETVYDTNLITKIWVEEQNKLAPPNISNSATIIP